MYSVLAYSVEFRGSLKRISNLVLAHPALRHLDSSKKRAAIASLPRPDLH